MSDIRLSNILPLDDPNDYKLHCAVWNGRKQPLDVFASDRDEWEEWNAFRPARDDFNREYIFSLIRFYHEGDTSWLFGGIFKVVSKTSRRYQVALQELGGEYIGRLKVLLKLKGRTVRQKLENYYNEIIVSEILGEVYSGQSFCGYERINLSLEQLQIICKHQRSDWRAALKNVKGVYLVTDIQTGKRYVGSAYGDQGIWSRWGCYAETGHGWNKDLTELLGNKRPEYARQNFRFTLLEYRSMRVDDDVILEREKFWKEALLTRGDFGHNRN